MGEPVDVHWWSRRRAMGGLTRQAGLVALTLNGTALRIGILVKFDAGHN
jgi:hypothetical protein